MNKLVIQIYFKNDLTIKHSFILIFQALLKMKKDLKCTFISFSSFDKSEKWTPGVFFQLFSEFDNVKILPSTCHFELVKVNELISTQYKFNPFWTEMDYLRKRNTLVKHDQRGSFRYYFTLFQIWETNLRKITFGVLFRPVFQTL